MWEKGAGLSLLKRRKNKVTLDRTKLTWRLFPNKTHFSVVLQLSVPKLKLLKILFFRFSKKHSPLSWNQTWNCTGISVKRDLRLGLVWFWLFYQSWNVKCTFSGWFASLLLLFIIALQVWKSNLKLIYFILTLQSSIVELCMQWWKELFLFSNLKSLVWLYLYPLWPLKKNNHSQCRSNSLLTTPLLLFFFYHSTNLLVKTFFVLFGVWIEIWSHIAA